MFFKRAITKSTNTYSQAVEALRDEIDTADAIIIGAGSGFSAAAGLAYAGERFDRKFPDFIAKYHFMDMYSATFYPYDSLEEYWAYMSRHIMLNRYTEDGGTVYQTILHLVKDKDYFVITTNVDHCFQKSGFSKHRIFYTQGDYGLWQCSEPCHKKTYDNEVAVHRMVAEQSDMRIPTNLIPHCPKCGKPMGMNLRCDNTFVEDEGWHLAANRYEEFIRRRKNLHVLFLELGVGGNTPVIIKYPFWKMTSQNQNAVYACINQGEAVAPREIQKQTICINEDIGKVILDVLQLNKIN